MKKNLLNLFLVLGSYAVQSQELVWHTDINKAIEISNKTKKPMLLFFTGSDWCGWCIRLQNEVFKKPEFTKWAKENVVLVELDFPRRISQTSELRNQNATLEEEFDVQGFPTIWFATAKTKKGKNNFTKLGTLGYVMGGSTAWLNSANDILKKK
jgi:thioredoxin-related protein